METSASFEARLRSIALPPPWTGIWTGSSSVVRSGSEAPPDAKETAEVDKVHRMIEEGTVGVGMTLEQVVTATGCRA